MAVEFASMAATDWERGIKHHVPSTGEALEKGLCGPANTLMYPGESSHLCHHLSHICNRPGDS